jgi:hypothetical protein
MPNKILLDKIRQIRKGIDLHDIKYDIALTNFSVAYKNQMPYIADKAFPVVPVNRRQGTYWNWSKEDFLRNRGKKWTPGEPLPTGQFDVDHTPTYNCEYRAFSENMRWDLIDEGDSSLQIEQSSAEFVTEALLLNRELEFVDGFFKTGIWAVDQTGVASAPAANQFIQWSDYDNSDPIYDIKARKRVIKGRCGMKPNTGIFSDEVMDVLVDHPLLIERYKYTSEGIVTNDMIAKVLGLDKIFVGGALQVTSAEGAATTTLGEIFGKNAWIGYVNPSPKLKSMSAGYTFAYTGVGKNIGSGYDVAVRRISDEETMVDKAQAIMCYTQKVVDATAGTFFSGAVA